MASKGIHTFAWNLVLALILAIFFIIPEASFARPIDPLALKMNVIDRCWRFDPFWKQNKQKLARCSVGFAGKMVNNVGLGLTHYRVIDPSDDPTNPKPGTLRYGATVIKGKVWITFKKNMHITLQKALLVSSFTAIDGRGADVHIANGGCFYIYKQSNIIIHGLHIHHCQPQAPATIMGPEGLVKLSKTDADAIRVITSSKIWIDHNALSECHDGLVDVTRGSTNVTISNNWFRDQDKVMLLGHDDGFSRDKDMKVTIVYNRFGPHCHQRMPRVRHGYAHVVNNLYDRWHKYAIGGSMGPSIKSQGNLFIAHEFGNKEVTWWEGNDNNWKLHSERDHFQNGASFESTGFDENMPHYTLEQAFPVVDAHSVPLLTNSAGALVCSRHSPC